MRREFAASALVAAILVAGCGGDDDGGSGASNTGTSPNTTATTIESGGPEGLVKVDGNRRLYIKCEGTGSPTVVMEGGDEDDSTSYAYAQSTLAKRVRTCVYDRANLGQSDPADGPRGLRELVSDLERLLKNADAPAPYVLVGTSGGGYIVIGYAEKNPRQVAGIVTIDTPRPFRDPPREIVEATDPDNPDNFERRDFLQVEADAWAGRKRIGDIPVRIITAKGSAAEIKDAPSAAEKDAIRRNVEDQKGWLVLSPQAKQVIAHTGHSVDEEDPELVIDQIRAVIDAAR